jgi:hypothetical protein
MSGVSLASGPQPAIPWIRFIGYVNDWELREVNTKKLRRFFCVPSLSIHDTDERSEFILENVDNAADAPNSKGYTSLEGRSIGPASSTC